MNQDYVATLERIVHNSKFGLIEADKQIKELIKKLHIFQLLMKKL